MGRKVIYKTEKRKERSVKMQREHYDSNKEKKKKKKIGLARQRYRKQQQEKLEKKQGISYMENEN